MTGKTRSEPGESKMIFTESCRLAWIMHWNCFRNPIVWNARELWSCSPGPSMHLLCDGVPRWSAWDFRVLGMYPPSPSQSGPGKSKRAPLAVLRCRCPFYTSTVTSQSAGLYCVRGALQMLLWSRQLKKLGRHQFRTAGFPSTLPSSGCPASIFSLGRLLKLTV